MVSDTAPNRERLLALQVHDRLTAQISAWMDKGVITPKLAAELTVTLTPPDAAPEPAPAPPPPEPAPAPAQRPRRPREQRPLAPVAQPEEHHAESSAHAGDVAASVFASGHATHGALEALASLDDVRAEPGEPSRWETEVRPLLYENIGWFVGTLFVLAGSVYGVREAWRSLGGVSRHLIVGAALLAYHAGFVGIARLLAPRSASTGRVLGGIALGLLPVAFVALSSLVARSLPVGAAASLAALALVAFTLRSVSARFAPSPGLALCVLPTLAAQLPLASLPGGSFARVALCFVGVATTARAATRAFPSGDVSAEPVHPFFAALYGSLALSVFALAGSSDLGSDLSALDTPFALWSASLAGVVALTTSRMSAHRSHPRASSVAVVLSLGAMAVATIWACGAYAQGARYDVARGLVAALTALGTAAVCARVSRRHPGALHLVVLSATVGTGLAAMALTSSDGAWWPLGFMLGPAGAMAVTRARAEAGDGRWRRVLLRWSVALSVPATLVTLGFALGAPSWSSWAPFACALATLAVGAHTAACARHRKMHLVGALATTLTLPLALRDLFDNFTLPVHGVALGGPAAVALAVLASALGALSTTPWTEESAAPAPAWLGVVRALRDAAAVSAQSTWLVGALLVAAWIPNWNEPQRAVVVHGAMWLVIAPLVAFVGRGFARGDLRAREFALWCAGAAIALTAVANRVGRPLPPPVVGWRLSVIAAGVWLLARAMVAWGPRIGRALGRDDRGAYYHRPVHAGVFALALVLGVDALLVAQGDLDRALIAVPPTMLLGCALALVLFTRSTRNLAWALAAGVLAAGGAALVAAQRSLLGLAQVRVAWSGGMTWVPADSVAAVDTLRVNDVTALLVGARTLRDHRIDAWIGLGLAGAAYALLAAWWTRHRAAGDAVARWCTGDVAKPAAPLASAEATAIAALTLVGVAWWPTREAALAMTVTGVALWFARGKVAGSAVTAAGLVAAVQSLAVLSPTRPAWTGPAAMLPALLSALLTDVAVRRGAWAQPALRRSEMLAGAVAVVAVTEALAAGAARSADWAARDLAWGAVVGVSGAWLRAPSLAVTLALCAITWTFYAAQWQRVTDADDAAKRTTATAVTLAGAAACAALGAGYVATHPAVDGGAWTLPFAQGFAAMQALGAPLALVAALTALAAQAMSRQVTHAAVREGLGVGRDLWLVMSLLFAGAFAGIAQVSGVASESSALPVGAVALVAGVVAAAHAAWREGTARHVYFVQLALVASYGLVRVELGRAWPPELDAMFALGLGFALVGVTVLARRAGIPPVAVATRRFAGCLPLLVALVMPREAMVSTALAAAASALLYGVLAQVERSKWFGSLGAAAGNVALLILALSTGWRGPEVWLAPLGLFVLMLGQIMGTTLAHEARVSIRVVGSLLVYAPAALQIALQVGNARDGRFAVLFGLACLVGIAAGMLLEIRAYLVLGLVFLVLDVVVNLVQAGLRDHRIGFLVLSLSGVSILATMVATTLWRDATRALVGRLTATLRRWD